MNEGALMLTADKTVLYANRCFARMVRSPLEQVTGGSFRRFLSAADSAKLRPLLRRAGKGTSQSQMLLRAGDGTTIPVQISICRVAKPGSAAAMMSMVVTDMTEARRSEELLRGLNRRVVRAQEDERRRVALELHDNIVQLLCGIGFRSQALVDSLGKGNGAAKHEARTLRDMLGQTVKEVERISRNLRPSALDQLGLSAVLEAMGKEFAQRTGIPIKLACVQLDERLPADSELVLYRILQEALRNVEQHASARNVMVVLALPGAFVEMVITDDGIGFNHAHTLSKGKGKGGFGLLGMHERAASVGGAVAIKSRRRTGTEIKVSLPRSPAAPAGGLRSGV
jgi:signal transduction histidine kinase